MNKSHIEELPQAWAYTSIGEVRLSNVHQGRPTGGGSFVYVDISSIDNKTKRIVDPRVLSVPEAPSRARQHLEPYDVLVSMTRPNLNAVALVPSSLKGSIGSTGFHVHRPHLVAPGWLFFLVQTNAFVEAMSLLVQGALYPAVRPKDIDSYTIPLAPVAEQHRIVAEIEKQFTRLDTAVAALNRAQANLKRYRASVLKAAYEGRLIPTEAELALREGREYEPADRLLARILTERRAKWEADRLAKMQAAGKPPKDDKWKAKYEEPGAPDTSDLPDLPDGWVWAKWDQVGFSQNGRSFPSAEYQQQGVKLLRPGNLYANGKVVWTTENTRSLPDRWGNEYPSFLVGPRELVMNLTAQSLKDEFLGRVCMTGSSERCLLNQRLARLTPLGGMSDYYLWIFKAEAFRRFVDGLNKGSLIQHMFTTQVARFVLPLPPVAEQYRIIAEIERRFSTTDEIESMVQATFKRAERLRQAILKHAFEGKLVPQDSDDEPASALLERIRAEREKASVGDGTRKPRALRRRGMAAEPSVRG